MSLPSEPIAGAVSEEKREEAPWMFFSPDGRPMCRMLVDGKLADVPFHPGNAAGAIVIA